MTQTIDVTQILEMALAQVVWAFETMMSADHRANFLLDEISTATRHVTNAEHQLLNDALEIQKRRAREFILTLNLQACSSRDLHIGDYGVYASRLPDSTYTIAWDSWVYAQPYFAMGDCSGFAKIATHSLTVRF